MAEYLVICNKVGHAEYLVLNLSEQITWVSQIVGADQNSGNYRYFTGKS